MGSVVKTHPSSFNGCHSLGTQLLTEAEGHPEALCKGLLKHGRTHGREGCCVHFVNMKKVLETGPIQAYSTYLRFGKDEQQTTQVGAYQGQAIEQKKFREIEKKFLTR